MAPPRSLRRLRLISTPALGAPHHPAGAAPPLGPPPGAPHAPRCGLRPQLRRAAGAAPRAQSPTLSHQPLALRSAPPLTRASSPVADPPCPPGGPRGGPGPLRAGPRGRPLRAREALPLQPAPGAAAAAAVPPGRSPPRSRLALLCALGSLSCAVRPPPGCTGCRRCSTPSWRPWTGGPGRPPRTPTRRVPGGQAEERPCDIAPLRGRDADCSGGKVGPSGPAAAAERRLLCSARRRTFSSARRRR